MADTCMGVMAWCSGIALLTGAGAAVATVGLALHLPKIHGMLLVMEQSHLQIQDSISISSLPTTHSATNSRMTARRCN